MSEGDFGESSANDTSLNTRDEEEGSHHKVLTPTLSSSPPRSRSQSAGSTHREALLFFERHKLFQPAPEEESVLPGIVTEDTSPFHFNAGRDQESSEISTFSKSPSPAHYSDIHSSSDDQRNYSLLFSGNQLDIPQPRARSKSDNLTLLVRQESKKKERFGDDTHRFSGNNKTLNTSGGESITNCSTSSEKSPQRNRSIRGRSHSQPSQVIVSCVGGGGFTVDGRARPAGESSSGGSRKGSKKYNWLEHIQFRAQFQHFRTNDYASVVNSASSLDKAGVLNEGSSRGGRGFQQVEQGPSRVTSEVPSGESGGGTGESSSQGSPPIGALSSVNRNSCWNFPRVKFRRIFNAKSLDDILGRGHPGSRKNSSCVSPETFPPVSSTSARNAPRGVIGAATTSDLDEETSSSFPPIKSKNSRSISSLKIFNPNPNSGITSVSSGSIGSGSESGGGGSKSKGKSLASVFQRIPQFHSSGKETGRSDGKTTKKSRKKGSSSGGSGGEKPSKSQSSGSLNRVSVAKSDNYLNRIVVSATCARFTQGKSADNLTTSQLETHKSQSAIKKYKKKSSSSTIVEAFSTDSAEASGSSSGVDISTQPQQRRWTAVKHKWDLKLQQSHLPPAASTDPSKPGNQVFIKSQLSQISGGSTINPLLFGESYNQDPTVLESCGASGLSSLRDQETSVPIKPHEAGRVKFCLEPEEIPSSPTISRSQSSDCKPIQVDPSLIGILDSNSVAEEESEEMTKSRHFHYSAGASSGGSKNTKGGRHKDLGDSSSKPSGGGGLTSKDIKAQLVVANVSYLQRPTSPCLLISPGDPSSSNPQSSSPIVFSPNNNFGAAAQSSVTSPVQNQTSTYHQTRMMKHEYLSSGSGSIGLLGGGCGSSGASRTNNLNERQIKENINRGYTPGGTGGHSSFVPSCVNRNDVISSPPPSRINGSAPNEPGGDNKTITKESKYGSGGDRVGLEQDSSHDDTIIYTNRYKDYSTGNKNVASAMGRQSSSQPHPPGERDAEDQLHSRDFLYDSGFPNLSGDYIGFDNRVPLTQSNQIGDLPQDQQDSSIPDSSHRNNNFQSQDSSEEQDEMGDLQSPTYVKRTAHMFNSKYSSQMNGSPSGDPIKENRNPSYLNVSRSVSGYSCLSYNNGVTTSTTNGSSSCTNGTSPYSVKYVSPTSTKVKSEFTIKVNQPQIRDHHHRLNEDDNDTMNNGDGRLIKSPTSPKSKYHGDDEELEDISEPDGAYVPSHGKSFIMQRIERLYGSDAVSSASVFSKSSVSKGGSTTTTTLKCETLLHSPGKGKERVIPIQIEKDFENGDELDRSSVSEKVAKEHGGYERLIRGDEMLVTEKSDEEEVPSTNNDGSQSNQKSCSMKSVQILTNSSFDNVNSSTGLANKIQNGSDGGIDAMYHEGVSLDICAGKLKLRNESLDQEEKQSLFTSTKINNGDHSHDSKPLTSPSPTKQSQSILLHEVASQGAIDANNKMDNYDEKSNYNSTVEASTSSINSPSTTAGDLGVKDGKYFLIEMNLTKQRLAELAERFGKEVEEVDESSERAGNILSAVGKANLLMKKKFKQFEELCNLNMQGAVADQPVTTNEDLEGFWDMVMIQVEQVYSLFQKLDGIEEPKSEDRPDSSKPKSVASPKRTSSTKLTKPVASKSQSNEAAKARDESRRKMLAERRRLMKNQTQETGTAEQDPVVICSPDAN